LIILNRPARPFRLFTGPLNNDIGWLLPLGALGLLLLIDLARRSQSAAVRRQLALWGGWLLVSGGVFSAAVFIHAHYMATLSPALAALAAIALRQLWRLYRARPHAGLAVLAVAATGLVIWQADIALQYLWDAPGFSPWLRRCWRSG
jgi:4-amino-4-deoxy-L-arabinose transferase-like glycosyltransferase